jgi:hypothetical protein
MMGVGFNNGFFGLFSLNITFQTYHYFVEKFFVFTPANL